MISSLINGSTLLVIALVSGMVVLGCKTASSDALKSPPGIDTLPTGAWRLTKLPAGNVPHGAEITLEFLPENKVAGSTGVNRYTGAVTSDGPGRLRFGPLATTRRAGPPAAMRLEEDFVGAIQLVTGYRIENGNLVLTDGANDLMTFRR